MKLRGKVAIVTGGSSGIGEQIALRFGREGAKVAIVSRRADAAGKVVEAIIASGGTARAFPCDVSDKVQVQGMVQAVVNSFGTVDILMGNAGFMVLKPLEELSEEDWDRTMDVNLKGNFLLAQAVAPIMKKKHYGKIILTGSIAGSQGHAEGAAYCASKGGVILLMKALVSELAKEGINVNCLSPGATATPLNARYRADPEILALFARNTPTGRDYVPPQDMAGAAVFLASEDARAVHGLNLVVDDGFSTVKPV